MVNSYRVEAAYRRSDLFGRRRTLMRQWADYGLLKVARSYSTLSAATTDRALSSTAPVKVRATLPIPVAPCRRNPSAPVVLISQWSPSSKTSQGTSRNPWMASSKNLSKSSSSVSALARYATRPSEVYGSASLSCSFSANVSLDDAWFELRKRSRPAIACCSKADYPMRRRHCRFS